MKSLSVTFVGGARKVTGAQFLVEAKNGGKVTKILVDCGLEQGARFCESHNREDFPYDPTSINTVFITHAHADHIGLYPKLVKDGFKGKAYTSAPTKDLIPIMLEDSVSLIAREAKACGEEPPYKKEDVEAAVQKLTTLDYGSPRSIEEGITGMLFNAGHILGSATVLLDVWGTRLLFTGDLGRVPAVLVKDRDVPDVPIHYLFSESVYGNRTHEDTEVGEKALLSAIERIYKKKGTLLIPSFSLERTQIILSIIDRFVSEKKIPNIPVFLDSPLATKVTEVYRKYPEFLRSEFQKRIKKDDDPFSFPNLTISYTHQDSKEIDEVPAPKVIIAGAGMSHGGRIRSHERTYLPEPQNELLLVGYQVPGSLGRRLQDGARTVTIDHKKVKVRAKVTKTGGFSAHADRDDLLKFAEDGKPEEVFVVLGEMESSAFLAQRIGGFLGIKTTIPQKGEVIELKLKSS